MGLSEEDFDEGIRAVAESSHLSYCTTRTEKLNFLFQQLDTSRSGQLTTTDIEALARRIAPNASPEMVANTLNFLDKDRSAGVSGDEFEAAMNRILPEDMELAELEAVIVRMLAVGRGEGGEV